MLKSKINFATAKTAIDFEWKVVFPTIEVETPSGPVHVWVLQIGHQLVNIKLDLNSVIFQISSLVEQVESISVSRAFHAGPFKWSAYIVSLCQFDILGRHWNMGNSGRVTHGICSFCFEMIHCQAGQMEVQSVRLNQRLTRKRFATQAPHTMTIAMNMYSQ